MDLFQELSEKKTLVIDDDERIRDSLGLFFQSEGCSLVALETAEEAIEALRNQSYDVIIADYRLPGMNGLEFFKRIDGTYPAPIKILITAYGNKKVLSEAKKLGIDDFVNKPFTMETIKASLSKLIEDHEREDVGTSGKHLG